MFISTLQQRYLRFIKKYRLEPFHEVAIFMIILLSFHFLYRKTIPYFSNTSLYLFFSEYLTQQLFEHSKNILQWLNFEFTIEDRTFLFGNYGYIGISYGCSGLKPIYQWIVLILLYPGKWKHKLWYIPIGIIIIHLTNIFRIIGLSYVLHWNPEYWKFSHDYLFRPFFYVVMFALWAFWNEHFYHTKTKKAA